MKHLQRFLLDLTPHLLNHPQLIDQCLYLVSLRLQQRLMWLLIAQYYYVLPQLMFSYYFRLIS